MRDDAMKIISWNLCNIGMTKINGTNQINNILKAANYGNSVLDFIIRVVMGNTVWGAINTPRPADVFIIIELTGLAKADTVGKAASGNARQILAQIVSAMDAASPNPANYKYDFVPPISIASGTKKESIGIIFNKILFSQPSTPTPGSPGLPASGYGLVLNSLGKSIATGGDDRCSPFFADLVIPTSSPVTALGNLLRVIGVHAPPLGKRGVDYEFRPPISYSERLVNCANVIQTPGPPIFVVGDFNCCPTSYYLDLGKNKVKPFEGLLTPPTGPVTWTAYSTALPAGALTSVRDSVDTALAGQAQYLSKSYDNIFYSRMVPPAPNTETALDLIGSFTVAGVGLTASLDSYRKVSNHIPVVAEW
jgi:hypothetical protein